MKQLLAAVVVVTAGMIVCVSLVGVEGSTAVAASVDQVVSVIQLGTLENIVETIDQFLEAVVDLLNTIQQLFGGGGD